MTGTLYKHTILLGKTTYFLIPIEHLGIFLEFLMTLDAVCPGANTNTVIPVFFFPILIGKKKPE
jgi:hypothetical protein